MTNVSTAGVELIPLTEDRLELVRRWRNSEGVRKFMEFQDEITPEMQRKWFESVNNENNYYFVIFWQGKEIGLSHIKNIDRLAKSGEAGTFIADPDYLDSQVPIQVALLGLDFCFGRIGLETVYGKTADDNTRARRMNAAFGYEPVEPSGEEGDGGRFRYYRLTKKSYYRHREHLMDLLYGTE